MRVLEKRVIRDPRWTSLLLFLLVTAVSIGGIGFTAKLSTEAQLAKLEAGHTTTAFLAGEAVREDVVPGGSTGISGPLAAAAESPYTKRPVHNATLHAHLPDHNGMASGSLVPEEYNYAFDKFTHALSVFAVRCTLVEEFDGAQTNHPPQQHVRFEILDCVSVMEGYAPDSLIGAELTMHSYFSGGIPCDPQGDILFEEGKTYLVRGLFEDIPCVTTEILHNAGTDEEYIETVRRRSDLGGAAAFHLPENVRHLHFTDMSLLTGPGSEGFYLVRSFAEGRTGAFDTLPAEDGTFRLPFFTEYTGDWREFLASEDGRIWREQVIPWTQLNQNSAPLILTEELNSLLYFNEGTASIAQGRAFTPEEYADGAAVCLISETFAEYADLQTGDTIRMELYNTDFFRDELLLSMRSSEDEGGWAQYSYLWHSTPAYAADVIGVQKEYTIIGVYRAPEYAPGQHSFTADTIIVPKASVPDAQLYERRSAPQLNSVIINNGTEQDFEAYMAQQGFGGYFVCRDQGYADLRQVYETIDANANRLLALGIIIPALAAALYFVLFYRRMLPSVRGARLLGADKRKLQAELLTVLLVHNGCAVLLGTAVAALLFHGVAAGLLGGIALESAALVGFSGGILLLLCAVSAFISERLVRCDLMQRTDIE